MSDLVEKTCPLCAEEMDPTDQQLKPCKCGYQICVWCWHHIVDMAEKDQTEGRCPACRTPYDKEKIVGATVNCDSLVPEGNKKVQKAKSKPSEGKKQLTSVRVIRRNLVYIIGLPLDLADEDLLQHKEYFGQYGKVLKVSMSRTASGVIQQFPNSTCSVYITYGKEEEAVRCIQAVHGFILDGRPLKACFGTTKYCHAWLRNFPCVNPDCLYLHEVGSQEDSFTKDEIISAYTRVQQITGATNIPQNRSGSMLPPPLDAYCSDSSSTKPIVKIPSTNTTSVPRYSPPSGSGSSSRSSALPAAASWGTHIANQQSLANSISLNGSSDKQRSTSVNGTLAFSAVVANAAHGPKSSSEIPKRPSQKEESQIVVDRSKSNVSKPVQHTVVVDSGSKRTTSPDRDSSSNGGRDIDQPSAAVNSIDSSNEAVEDVPTVSNLSVGVAGMGITTNSRDESPDIPMMIGSQCDQGSIRQPDHEESKLPHVEQFRMGSSVNTDEKAISSEEGFPPTRQEWDWRSGLQTQTQDSSNWKLEDISSFESQRNHPAGDDVRHSRFPSSSLSFNSNNVAPLFSRPFESSGVSDSDLRSSFDRGSDRLHFPNGYGEKSMSNVDNSLYSNEGRNKVRNSEDDIISNILSLDFDPWDESLTTPHNLAELLGEVDQRSSTLKSPNLLKKHNNQSRFSFARDEETSNQAFGNENFEKLFEHVKNVNIDNAVTLSGVISQIFDKALMEPTFCEMYADFCLHLSGALPDFNENGEKITFKRLLLNKCQEEFERGEKEEEEASRVAEEGQVEQTDEEREEKRLKVRRRMLGNIRLIGELYKKKMLTEKIMHACIQKLLGYDQDPHEENIEALCKLMSTIGVMIDHNRAKAHMDVYFEKMRMLSNKQELSSRVRFMLINAIDLRKNKWQERMKVEGPKKIDEVHRDAAQERQTQANRLSRGPSMNSSTRRGHMEFSPRGGGGMLSPPSAQMGGFHGPPQTRGYGNQDIRFDERAAYEPRMVQMPQRSVGEESVVSRDIYRDGSGSLNGFSSNYSVGSENFAASPLFSSYKNPVSRPQVSAPPGFSAPSRLPPPGFSSHERAGLSSDTAPGTRFLDSISLLRNAYQVPPPLGNPGGAIGDIEFVDPAILAVGRGMVNADLDKRSEFSSQRNSIENEAGLQLLRQQQSLSAAQQQVNGFRNISNLSPSFNDPYGFSSRPMDHQTQGNSLSHFSQLPRQQPSANSGLSNGHWDKWNEGQSVNPLGMAELLRNERLGYNGGLYNNGYEEPKFRIPSPGDVYNRTYGM